MPKRTTTINTHRTPHSVLLSKDEDARITHLAARLTLERGKTQSKSSLMREAILQFVEQHNGRGQNVSKKKASKTKPS